MRNFIKKMIMMIMAVAAFFFATPAMAQKAHKGGKISAATRLIIKDRDGGMSFEKAKAFAKEHKSARKQKMSKMPVNGNVPQMETLASTDAYDPIPVAEPVTINGVKMVQCWITMHDTNYSPIEALGVKILSKFKGMVTANIPVDAIEAVAALDNVKKVSVAKKLKHDTYYAREATNVDDILNYTADAQAAGLLQAYDGTGVVIGIIDTGIQFDHVMFKDENGHTRIKKAIVYDSNTEQLVEYNTQSEIESLTYDTNTSYHGSHTSSIAGGSNMTFNGYYYDNSTSSYVNGTRIYGGMAPKADLVLCGLAGQLTDTNIATCIQKISEYADQVGKPCVISISLGSQAGPHDGTGFLTEVEQQYMSGPGKVIIKAAGNDGDKNVYLYKNNATKASPSQSLLDLTNYDGVTSGNYTLYNIALYGQTITYARTPDVELAARFYVVDTSNNTIVWVSDEMTEDKIYSVEEVDDPDVTYDANLANYFESLSEDGTDGFLCAFFDTDEYTGKQNIFVNVYNLWEKEYTESGSTLTGKYKIGLSCYPKNNGATTDIDSWGSNYTYFGAGTPTYNGTTYTFEAGNSLCSISDDSTSPYVIPIGNYSSMMKWVASNRSGYTLTNGTLSDISPSSSYQAPGAGPLGTKLPWITAPGQMIVAAFNRGWVENNSSSTYLLYQYDATNPLGVASGTSMASPCAGGIVALWMQADPTLTIEDVKALMASTAIKDSYVNGTNASHFGNGKIDALAGIEEILANKVYIAANPQSLTMTTKPNETKTETFTVKGNKLTGDVTATLNDPTGFFSISPTTISKATALSSAGGTITVTYAPTAEGNHTATITLSSAGADDVTVTINGVCEDVKEYVYVLTSTLTAGEEYLIVSRNSDGKGYALGHSGTNVAADDVSVKSNADVADNCYIEESDVDATSIWTVDNGWTFKNGDYYMGVSGNNNYRYISFGTSRSYWTWDENLNRLHINTNKGTYYIRYYYNNFSVSTSQSNIYLYQKVEKKKAAKINVTPTELTFDASVGETVTKTFNVKGTNLKGAISATLTTNQGNVYSLDASSISVTEAQSGTGKNITVTFRSDVAGTFNGTVTLTSTGAGNKTVTLTGIAHAPSLEADPTTLTFETKPGTPVTGTFDVIGEYLKGNVTLTLAGDAVFSINKTSIAKDNNNEVAETVTVTFSPTANGEYSGTVTLTSDGIAEPVVVTLNGSAYPDGYDVVIGSYGVTTLYVDFPLTIPYVTYDPDLLGVFVVKSAEDGEVKLYRLSSDIPANTGVVVMGNKGTYAFPRNRGEVTPLKTDNLLYGYIENTPRSQALTDFDKPNGIVMTLGKGTQGYIGFYKYTGGTLNANKAFLIYEPTAGNSNVSMLSIAGFGGDDLTGIRDLQVVSDGDWYTLQGVKLNGQPRQSGLYIHNGKTVVVK